MSLRTVLAVLTAFLFVSCADSPQRTSGADAGTSHSGRARHSVAAMAPAELAARVDPIFDEVMARYRLPGMALGVVANGEIAYRRAAGERIAGSGEAIDGDTLFKIASNSKAMTTAVLARLIDAGKLEWDDPVVRHLPAFRMHDPWVTEQIQVRDLLIHNAGLREGAGDLMMWPEPNSFTRADILAGLAHLKPQYSFRSRYAYDNLLYIVAGEVAAAAGGVPYEELVRRELFEPLGMNRCQAGMFRRDDVGNLAQPHMRKGEGNLPVRVDGDVVQAMTAAAAGGIRCSLNDMLRWLKLWLDPEMTTPGGTQRWLSREQREKLWSVHIPMGISARQRSWDASRFQGYGYGWRVSDVDGVLRVAHTGTLMGMYSAVVLLPEKRSGFVFMINGEGSEARVVLTQVLVKLFTAPGSDSSVARYAGELERARMATTPASTSPSSTAASMPAPAPAAATAAAPSTTAAPATATVASGSQRQPAKPRALAQWLGTYRDPWFGEAAVCEEAGTVLLRSARSPLLSGTVIAVNGRWLVDWTDDSVDADAWLDFSAEGTGVRTLRMAKVDPEADFSYDYEDLAFTRIGDCARMTGATASPPSPDAQVDALMRSYGGDAAVVPGASVLVLRDGAPMLRRAYGYSNLEDATPATPQTNYRLASVTKQFTSAAILLLAQDGRLKLDDRARRWLPSLPAAARDVTIRHLLSHMSGLIDYEDVVPATMTRQLHDSDVLEILEQQNRTYFPPGKGYRYSNSGYALLALIVERVSGKSFATFLRERIFTPLGMNATLAHEEGSSSVTNRAYGYSSENGAWRRTDQSQTSAVLGDGGIYSSIDDLARWDAALYDSRLLSDESRRLAFTPITPTDDPAVEYAFGWRITGETLWHSGETMGFRNVIVRFPKQRLTVVVLTNRNDPEPYRTALAIAQLYLPR